MSSKSFVITHTAWNACVFAISFASLSAIPKQQNGPLVDPVWVIGTVIALPQNTWSDGYSSGLEVVNLVCTGTSAFWETEDPAQEIQWTCTCT